MQIGNVLLVWLQLHEVFVIKHTSDTNINLLETVYLNVSARTAFCCIEGVHPLRSLVKAAVLRDIIKETLCITAVNNL
jgi:hypothetical protein